MIIVSCVSKPWGVNLHATRLYNSDPTWSLGPFVTAFHLILLKCDSETLQSCLCLDVSSVTETYKFPVYTFNGSDLITWVSSNYLGAGNKSNSVLLQSKNSNFSSILQAARSNSSSIQILSNKQDIYVSTILQVRSPMRIWDLRSSYQYRHKAMHWERKMKHAYLRIIDTPRTGHVWD